MQPQLLRIKDLYEIIKLHNDNGGKLSGHTAALLADASAKLEFARDEIVKELLRNGETIGTITMALAVSPARVRELARSMSI